MANTSIINAGWFMLLVLFNVSAVDEAHEMLSVILTEFSMEKRLKT
jgi:uncharacterized protein Smg (DUF494 family)